MPKKEAIERAKQDAKEGKSPSTQAGEFIKAEIDEIREGKHGARSTKQAIAIGLSEARRAGVKLPPPKKGKYGDEVREKAQHDLEAGKDGPKPPNPKRSKASTDALKREGTNAASHAALSRHAKTIARGKTAAERSEIGKKAAKTRKRNEENNGHKAD